MHEAETDVHNLRLRMAGLDIATGLADFGMKADSGAHVRYAPFSRSLASLNLEIYHSKARLGGNREGLLVDPGAHRNLSCDRWVKRVSALAPTPVQYQLLDQPQTVEGVGAGVQQCL